MDQAASLYRLLGEDVRLRLLRVLARERLNVTELTAVLGPAGGFTYYSVNPDVSDGPLAGLWGQLQAQFAAASAGTSSEARADDARLQEVLRLRRENFDTHGNEIGQLVPGRSWAAWARALGHLLPRLDVADLGCGEGRLTIEAARWAARVYGVDRSPLVLRRARALARKQGLTNIVWKRGEIERVPLKDASVDVALLSQALHHAGDPARGVAEGARVLRPGGRLLLLELRPHDQAWVKERLGDQWLGFSDDAIVAMLRKAGLVDIRVQIGARKAGGPFTVIVASGRKPERLARARQRGDSRG
ncbi:MAG: class I SAM-dependent methyltransferase [Acidobacteria bacterium]|nr:class I SAM-dependent methyltransferase [Acidobacteriota bacterium]